MKSSMSTKLIKHNKTVGWVVLITMVVSFMALMSQKADADPGDPAIVEDASAERCAWPPRDLADGSTWDRIRIKERSTIWGFLDHRYEPCYFDWSTNRCSFSPDTIHGWPFWKGCIRHDFMYQNLRQMEDKYNQNYWTVHNESVADVNLFSDLKNICDQENGGAVCNDFAYTYYKRVCAAGASNCCPGRPDIYNDGHCLWEWNELEVKIWVKQKAVGR